VHDKWYMVPMHCPFLSNNPRGQFKETIQF